MNNSLKIVALVILAIIGIKIILGITAMAIALIFKLLIPIIFLAAIGYGIWSLTGRKALPSRSRYLR